MIISGDVTTKAGNTDPLEWTLVDEDGVLIDITAAVSAKLRLKALSTGVITEFNSTDPSPKFTFNTTTSKCILTPDITDFTVAEVYKIETVWYDASGDPHHVPNDIFPILKVLEI